MSHPPPRIPRPVLPISFISPSSHQRRPGVVTALGVISIIVAMLTSVACLVVIIWSFVMLASAVSRTAPAPVRSIPMQSQVKTAAPDLQEDSLDGLSKKKRGTVLLGLIRARSLAPQHMKQMDALLSRSGRLMFPSAGQNTDAKFIRNNVTESGRLPSSKNPAGADGPTFYIIGTGRIEIYDDHAVFRPTGSSDVVSVRANEVDLDRENQAPPVFSALPPNTATVKEEKSLAAFLLFEALAAGALAIYLFVAGILVLRSTLASRKLHWIYLCIKIPLALLAIAATARLWSAYREAARLNPTSDYGAEKGMAMGVLIATSLALLYPIALMVVLRSRGVKDYYVQAKEDALARTL